VAVIGVACVACVPPLSDDARSDSAPRAPAAPSFAQDAANASDAPASDDAAPVDASEPEASDAATEACPTQAYCDGKLLVTPTPGRLFCSEKTMACQFGCVLVDGGVACAAFEPASCPKGVPWESATTCPYMFKSLCFDTKTTACECAGCGDAGCTADKLKFPKPLDGGLLPSLPSHVSCGT
jgi:hypothetical protein